MRAWVAAHLVGERRSAKTLKADDSSAAEVTGDARAARAVRAAVPR